MAIGFEPFKQCGRVKAKDNVICAAHKILEILGFAALDIAVVQCILQVTFAAVNAVHMEARFCQFQSIFATQQAQPHDKIAF